MKETHKYIITNSNSFTLPFCNSCFCFERLVWTKCFISERRAQAELLLETLEQKDPIKRFTAARRLLYIAQGKSESMILILQKKKR